MKQILISVDVEYDGPAPGLYSMIALGAVVIEKELNRTFLAYLSPISDNWISEYLQISGFSREETLKFHRPLLIMANFNDWIESLNGEPLFVADNCTDQAFVNYYFWKFLGKNPFGHTSLNLGSFNKGLQKLMNASLKPLRKTAHDHNPLNDAIGNAEAYLELKERYEFK